MVFLSDPPDQESGQAFSLQPEISRASATKDFTDRHVNPLNSERDLRRTDRHQVAFALVAAMASKSVGCKANGSSYVVQRAQVPPRQHLRKCRPNRYDH